MSANQDSYEIQKLRKQLLFRSWHRGTKEMDLILGSFADKHLKKMNRDQLKQYESILEYHDALLYEWITGKSEPPANALNPILQTILEHQFCSSIQD